MRDDPFVMEKEEKDPYMLDRMLRLTRLHRSACPSYAAMLAALGWQEEEVRGLDQIPFLPAGLFKRMTLTSLPEGADARILTSSGTGSGERARIVLDGEARARQQEALVRIGTSFLGKKRLPMLVIDTESILREKAYYTARTSAILGFSIFGTHRTFALREDYSLDTEKVRSFLGRYGTGPFLIFGFTFLVYRYLLQVLEEAGDRMDMSRGILVHGGGWKKLASFKVSREEFADRLRDRCGIRRVIDYYGMAEQTGSIFMECPCGHLHCSDYSAVLVRKGESLSLCEKGETGFLQVLSVLPESYPGHSILTEDLGRILGEDDCPCGRKGVYFEVLGRARGALLRGCSDTFTESQGEESAPFAEELTFLIGDMRICREMPGQEAMPPFHERTGELMAALSARLAETARTERNAELMTFAFWCRRAHFHQMAGDYRQGGDGLPRLGLGVSFQIAPGNMAMQFAYSMAAALLAGNAVILRLPGRRLPGQEEVCDALRELLQNDFADFAPRIAICRYGHDAGLTAYFTGLCSQRVLWGTDAGIARIRQETPLGPGRSELLFPSRDSAAMITAESILKADDAQMEEIARAFYQDTFLTDQNACASPHAVFWTGCPRERDQARQRFWHYFEAFLRKKEWSVPGLTAVHKLEAAMAAAAEHAPAGIVTGEQGDMRIVRLLMRQPDPALWNYMQPAGFFMEFGIPDPGGAGPMLGGYCQTLTLCGTDAETVAGELQKRGIRFDGRLVPFGHALDFSLYWDGHDLIREMSRLAGEAETEGFRGLLSAAAEEPVDFSV